MIQTSSKAKSKNEFHRPQKRTTLKELVLQHNRCESVTKERVRSHATMSRYKTHTIILTFDRASVSVRTQSAKYINLDGISQT